MPNSNIRQAVVTIAIAVLLAIAALCNERANDLWDESVHAEVEWAAATTGLIRQTYVDQAASALSFAIAQNQAEVLRTAAATSGQQGRAAGFDGQVQLQWTWHLAQAIASKGIDSESLISGDYAAVGAGYDVVRFLGDQYRRSVSDLGVRIEGLVEKADSWRILAETLAGLVVVVIGVYMILEWLVPGSPTATADVDLVPRPWVGSPVAAFCSWSLLGILPFIQLHAVNDAARAESDSARAAVRLSAAIGGGLQFRSLRSAVNGTSNCRNCCYWLGITQCWSLHLLI